MGKRDGSSRGDLRRRVRELEQERDLLVARLQASTRELRRAQAWTGTPRPSLPRSWFNRAWTRLTAWAYPV